MIMKVIGAFLAIYAFGVILETPKKYLWCAGVVGAVGWFVYLLSQNLGMNDVMATFLSATAISIVSHIFARTFRAPVTVFLVAGILPTVPGAGMYRIASSFIAGDSAMAAQNLIITLEIAGAIAIGIFLVDGFFRLFQQGWKQNSMRYEKNNK